MSKLIGKGRYAGETYPVPVQPPTSPTVLVSETIVHNDLGDTTKTAADTAGLNLENRTEATLAAQRQDAPSLNQEGAAWDTDGAVSVPVKTRIVMRALPGTTVGGTWGIERSFDGGATWNDPFLVNLLTGDAGCDGTFTCAGLLAFGLITYSNTTNADGSSELLSPASAQSVDATRVDIYDLFITQNTAIGARIRWTGVKGDLSKAYSYSLTVIAKNVAGTTTFGDGSTTAIDAVIDAGSEAVTNAPQVTVGGDRLYCSTGGTAATEITWTMTIETLQAIPRP